MRLIPVFLFFIVVFAACNAPETDIEVELDDQQFAVPLVNTKLKVSTITDNTEGSSVEVDAEGKLTVFYNGDVIERKAEEIFMPIDTVLPIPIINGFPYPLPVSQDGDEVINATFGNTNIWFQYTNPNDEDITLTIKFNEFSKDGEPFGVSFMVPPGSNIVSDTFSLTGVDVNTENNQLNFVVTAANTNGEELNTGLPILNFDQFDLTFIEGKFAERVFDIEGDIITVGIFENWISGNVQFVDPKLRVSVDNGFGVPVSSIFQTMNVTNTEGEILRIESTLIDNGVSVDYPAVGERGQTKNTTFDFNKDNSNIETLFGQRATRVTYDIDALVNPGTPDLIGFMDRSSFFRIKVALEVPLEGTVNDFLIEGNTEFDGADLDDVKTAEFKIIFENGFPLDLYSQLYFETADGTILDSLFDQGTFLLPSATLGANDIVASPGETTVQIPFSEERLDRIKSATNLLIRSRMDTPDFITGPVHIYDDYQLGVKMGAILTIDN